MTYCSNYLSTAQSGNILSVVSLLRTICSYISIEIIVFVFVLKKDTVDMFDIQEAKITIRSQISGVIISFQFTPHIMSIFENEQFKKHSKVYFCLNNPCFEFFQKASE